MRTENYIAHIAGDAGGTAGFYCFGEGLIIGVDAGAKYDGIYKVDDQGSYQGLITYSLNEETRVEAVFSLPANFWDGRLVRFPTAMGMADARFERLSEASCANH